MHLSNSQHSAEMVLLVEDEDLLREMLEDTLSEAGFGVLSAASGEEAAELLAVAPLGHRHQSGPRRDGRLGRRPSRARARSPLRDPVCVRR